MSFFTTASIAGMCKRYGPGRLPKADSDAIGMGYAAASAAVAATVLYALLFGLYSSYLYGIQDLTSVVFFSIALPFVVPAAFLVGVVGWRVLPVRTRIAGLLAGGLGAVATYVIASLFLAIVLTTAAIFSVNNAAVLTSVSAGFWIGTVAFVLTWWVAIPVGSLSGYVYVRVYEEST